LKPNEEEWREIFNRLSERFPTVPGEKVAKAIRDRNGHAGEAAAALRDLTGSSVKEADPDDVEHVATLLSSPAMFKHACKEQFRKCDVNKDGVLEWEEVKALTCNLYEEFGLAVPAEGALKAFFYATDENQDGVLSEREFRKFFEMFLRFAFFDHLKLRQMVEKGQEIERQRNGSIDGPIKRIPEVRDDAETSSPLDSRASSASTGSKPPVAKEEAPPREKPQPKPTLAPIDQPKAAGRRSPPSGQDKDERRRHRDRDRQDKERERASPSDTSEGYPMRCVASNGVAYRNSAAFQDRTDVTVSRGDTIRVLEHWVRTPDGWLPVVDQQGQCLLERCSMDNDNAHNSKKREDKRVMISDKHSSREADTLETNVRSSVSPSRSEAAEGGGGGSATLTSSEEEWRPVFERLVERFPHISHDKIVQALRDNDGHAGKAASMLRYM
jgi:hypothetical protein